MHCITIIPFNNKKNKKRMNKIVEIKVLFPDEGLQLEEIVGRVINDLKKLAILPIIPSINGDNDVIRHINVLHQKGKIVEYRIEDYIVAPNGTAYTFPDWRRNLSLEELDL